MTIALLASVVACSSGPEDGGRRIERGLVADPAAIAQTVDDALFTVDCTFSHRLSDDPIVRPGEPGASHSHDFFGNATTDANSTGASLLGHPTTCEDPDDTASYWVPTLSLDGAALEPTLLRAYYRAAPGADVTTVQAPPAGLMLLAGNPKAIAPQSTDVAGWGCGLRPRRLLPTPPNDCTAPSPLTLQLFFPDCWDGERLDSEDHRAHAAYSDDGACPATHPVPITELQLSIQYPVTQLAAGVTLASGAAISAHGDFLNGWVQERLEAEVQLCIHAHANCTIG